MFHYGGYAGKLLRVDLNKSKTKIENLQKNMVETYLGGRGFGAKILYDEVMPSVDPLDPENKLIVATGPLTGTTTPSAPKFTVITKSPLTEINAHAMASGYFAPELKFAGFDCLIVEGRAKKPAFLWINNGRAELRRGDWLWGMTTEVTQRLLKEELDTKAQVACIGPAGEHLVKFACIISGWRAAGRGGAGAVMGSKRLKAIAVRGDEGSIKVIDPEEFQATISRVYADIRKNPLTSEVYPKYGTTYNVEVMDNLGMYPTMNFQEAVFEGAKRTSGEILKQTMMVRNKTCHRCPISCTKISQVKSGRHAGTTTRGPEYETLWAFSAQCGIDSLPSILAANEACDRQGLDTISTGNVLGFAMECYKKGLITEEETNGLKLDFGNTAPIVELIKKIAYRESIGEILAEGVRGASRKIGKESVQMAMHVKGLELPGYDPRGAWGMGLAYATANRGGCHLNAWTIGTEVKLGNYERFSADGKASLVKRMQDARTAIACTGFCLFATKALEFKTISKLVSAVTGMNIPDDKLLQIGERVYNIERLYNVNAGLSRKDDTLPRRLFEENIPKGPASGHKVEREGFEEMLSEYYKIRGWNNEGVPTSGKLSSLGIVK